eukprot:7381081-Prymnesium_polylepis.1
MDGRAGTRGHWCGSCHVPGVTGRSRRFTSYALPVTDEILPRTGHVPITYRPRVRAQPAGGRLL